MKISEMTNDQAADALIRLAIPFGNICDDKDVVDILSYYKKTNDDVPVIEIVGKMLPRIVGCLFKTHKDDLFEIVGALTFKSTASVAKMKFVDTVKILKESYDEVLQSFFISSAMQIKDAAKES